MQKEWFAVEARRRPEDLPRLLRALQQTHGRSTDARARAVRLRRWPSDPRVPALLVAELLAPSFSASSSRPFWNEVFNLFLAHPSRHAIALLSDCQQKLSRRSKRPAERAMHRWLQRRAVETMRALEPLCADSRAPRRGRSARPAARRRRAARNSSAE